MKRYRVYTTDKKTGVKILLVANLTKGNAQKIVNNLPKTSHPFMHPYTVSK